MMGALPLKVLEPFPSLIKGLPISLNEGSDVVSLLCSFSRGEVFAEEALERSSQVVNELDSLFCSQSSALPLSEKGKSLNLIAPVDTLLS